MLFSLHDLISYRLFCCAFRWITRIHLLRSVRSLWSLGWSPIQIYHTNYIKLRNSPPKPVRCPSFSGTSTGTEVFQRRERGCQTKPISNLNLVNSRQLYSQHVCKISNIFCSLEILRESATLMDLSVYSKRIQSAVKFWKRRTRAVYHIMIRSTTRTQTHRLQLQNSSTETALNVWPQNSFVR